VDVVAPPPELPKTQPADPRTIRQQIADRRAFERCLLRAQARQEDATAYNPLAPEPAELCRQRTSMRSPASAPSNR
jgi:hypothetical protein